MRTIGKEPESPQIKPPAANPGGNLGMTKGATSGFGSPFSHSQNRESRDWFA